MTTLTSILALFAALAAGTPATSPVEDARTVQDAEAIARAADAALADLTSLGSEFHQEVENPILERTSTGRGTLLYKAPRKFRIAYSEPAGDVVVNDGSRVWIYLPSSQPGQVIRQPAAESGVQNPLTYLRDLRRHFDARHAGRETVAGRAADHLAMTPETDRAPFARLDVWVDASTKLPRQVRTTTSDGVVTTYTFRTFQRNVPLADRLFTFSPPEGVEVFDQ
ncbi:MAG: outer membrane lipoprotein chaperone LolA [Gemmatimonadetes bacterium]|nr:outer membrane lipoprotein chaperone LolA [Gemmatimonadota bacterium]